MFELSLIAGIVAVSLAIYGMVDISGGNLTNQQKIFWFTVVILLPIVGPLFYFLTKRRYHP